MTVYGSTLTSVYRPFQSYRLMWHASNVVFPLLVPQMTNNGHVLIFFHQTTLNFNIAKVFVMLWIYVHWIRQAAALGIQAEDIKAITDKNR